MPGVVHVVDDDTSFQTATECLLKQAGYAVASYPSAEYFLDHLPNESVRGCILLKVRMPGLSGPELQERLNERRFGASGHILQSLSRYSNHSADHQGGCVGLSNQAHTIRPASSSSRTGHCAF